MNELATTDLAVARSFYEDLFRWTTEGLDAGRDGPLALAFNDETLNASSWGVSGGAGPHWRPVFTVESIEAALAQVRGLSGKGVRGPLELPDGSTALALDPQGALFGLFAGEVDP
jgi:uncharacterized protein